MYYGCLLVGTGREYAKFGYIPVPHYSVRPSKIMQCMMYRSMQCPGRGGVASYTIEDQRDCWLTCSRVLLKYDIVSPSSLQEVPQL